MPKPSKDPGRSHQGVFRVTFVPYEPEQALRIRVQMALGRVVQCPKCTEVLRRDPPKGVESEILVLRCQQCRREVFIRSSALPDAVPR